MRWLKNIIFEEKISIIENSLRETTLNEEVLGNELAEIAIDEKEEDVIEPELNIESIRNIKKRESSGTINQKHNNLWLSEKQITELFEKTPATIKKYINSIYKENELEESKTSKKVLLKKDKKEMTLYSIEIIIAIGFKIPGQIGNDFRIWATKVIAENYRRTGEIKM